MSKIKLSDYEFFLFFIGSFYFLWIVIPKFSALSDPISMLLSVLLTIFAFLLLKYATKTPISQKSIYLSLTSAVLVYFSIFSFPLIKSFMSLSPYGFGLIILLLIFFLAFMEEFGAKIFDITLITLFALLFLMQINFSTITAIVLLATFLIAGVPIFIKMYEGNLSFTQNTVFQVLLAFLLLAEIRIITGLIL